MTSLDARSGPRPISVIIPAHNEERTISACLYGILPGLSNTEVIVVANGCTDGTADAARKFREVLVIDSPVAGKAAALNAGDGYARNAARIYLDADIRIDAATVRALGDAITVEEAVVAAPTVVFDTTTCTTLVRSFYRVFSRTTYATTGMVGLGIYGLSPNGRKRFREFPDILGDDLFVQRMFDESERRTTLGQFVVTAPRNLPNLLKVRTRVARGNREVASRYVDTRFARTTKRTNSSILQLLWNEPHLLPSVIVYTSVSVYARVMARITNSSGWERDESTREQVTSKNLGGN